MLLVISGELYYILDNKSEGNYDLRTLVIIARVSVHAQNVKF